MADFEPAYLALARSGELKNRAELARERLAACELCGHRCGVNRFKGQTGRCRTGAQAVVSSVSPHFGEEAPLVGRRGSGTIFFSWCNLQCHFCQNYEISQMGHGAEVGPEKLARLMLDLQALGCHNVNFVSPSHVVPQILAALEMAAQRGLNVPLVYNTGGYDTLETLALLDGLVDIYMPDMKYGNADLAKEHSEAPDYPQVNFAAVKEMHRQVGDLDLDPQGVARRGLLVRHLVLPNGLADTAQVVHFLADEVSKDTYINVMDQYRPCFRADHIPPLSRPITTDEYAQALRLAEDAGLHRLDNRRARRWRL